MKKQLSSVDLHYLVNELEVLKDSKIDKIYQPEKEIIIFGFYKTNSGKKFLRINVGQSACIVEEKEAGETLGFGMFLRKHLEGFFLSDIGQINPERIIKISFSIKDEKKYLYLEFFGRGNAILCDGHNVILNALEHHEFRERVVKPRLKYVYPVMNYNIFDLNENDLIKIFTNSKKESLVTALATELGLGGLYSEEVCLLSNVDKNINPKNIGEKQTNPIKNSIKKIITHKIEPLCIFEDAKIIDFTPFGLKFYSDERYQKQGFSTFSEAVSFFYSHFKEEKETEFDKKQKSLQHIIEQQKSAVEQLKNEERDFRHKGEIVYHNYNTIKEILDEINKASKKYSWKEIKEKLKGHKMIMEINEKDREVVVEI